MATEQVSLSLAEKQFSGQGRNITFATFNAPAIPAGATLTSIYINCPVYRDGGPMADKGKVRFYINGHLVHDRTGVGHATTDYIFTVTDTSVFNSSGTNQIQIWAGHDWVINGDAKWHTRAGQVICYYTLPTYTVTVSSNNSSYGYTTGSGTYNSGTALTMSAHPYAGYKFVQWSDGVTSAVRAVSVTGNATYTAQFRPIYISYDSVFSYKMWADTNLVSTSLIEIVSKTDTGFTGKAIHSDTKTSASEPVMKFEGTTGLENLTFELDTSSKDFECFIFNCRSNNPNDWGDFTYVPSVNKVNFTRSTNFLSVRCDIIDGNASGKVVTFSNFRMYPTNRPYMSNSVTAAERTGRGGQAMPTPTREGYTFKGWNTKPDGTGTTYTASNLPTDDIILYSQWTVKTFKVTFKDDNGYTLKTETVNYGSTVTAPSDPVKDDTAQWDYTFKGWYDANGNKWTSDTVITSDTVFTAQYTAVSQMYIVRWYNYDGTLLETDTDVPYGIKPTYNGATPAKAGNAEHSYQFAGWNYDTENGITPSLGTTYIDITAQFTEIDNTYTVEWVNEGKVIETDTLVPYGATPDYDEVKNGIPTKASDAQYDYTFIGWSTSVSNPAKPESELETVKGDVTYTAVYSATLKLYPVKVILFDTEYTSVVEYGSDIVLEAPEVIGYKFTQWADGNTDNPRTVKVTGEATYQAVYERIPFPIMVNNEQVTGVYIVPSTQTIVYVISGEVPVVEANEVTVDGWSFEVSNSVPNNSYLLEKLYINETRVY